MTREQSLALLTAEAQRHGVGEEFAVALKRALAAPKPLPHRECIVCHRNWFDCGHQGIVLKPGWAQPPNQFAVPREVPRG